MSLFDTLIDTIFEKVEDDKVMRIMFGDSFDSEYDKKIKGILKEFEDYGYTVTLSDNEFPKITKDGVDYAEKALIKHLQKGQLRPADPRPLFTDQPSKLML